MAGARGRVLPHIRNGSSHLPPPPHKQVDRDTFPAALAALKAALASASFAALDLEMTGTSPPPGSGAPPPARCDDAPDRWHALAAAASAYLVLQVGVAAFAWDEAGAAFTARTFNFTIFPYTPPEVVAAVAAAAAPPAAAPGGASAAPPPVPAPAQQPPLPPAPPFLASPAALAFLASAGFDFNRWVRKGIPFTPAAARDAAAGRAGAAAARARDRPPIVPTRPADVALVAGTTAVVEAWLAAGAAAGAAAPPLALPPVNGFQRALIYELLDRLNGGAWGRGGGGPGAGAGAAAPPPRFIAETVRVPGAHRRAPAGITLTRVTGAAEADARASARDAAAAAGLDAAAGAAAVLDALRDARLPVALHNGALDLALTIGHLGDGPAALPPTWDAFARRVGAWFPGGVVDTKVLAMAVLGEDGTSAGTSLRAVYDACCCGGVGVAAAGGGGGPAPPATAPPSPWVPAPPPVHAPGFDRYASASAAFEHEAGFDAFMTGAALIGCARALAAAAAREAAARAAAALNPRALVAALEAAPSSFRPASAAATSPPSSCPLDLPSILAAHGGHLFAFASDRGVIALGPSPPPPPPSPPTARDHLIYIVPLPPSLGWGGAGRVVGEAVAGLGLLAPCAPATQALVQQPRLRVLPRCGGAAAVVEVFELHDTSSSNPPLPPPAPAPPLSVAEKAATLATALAAHPALVGCRVLSAVGYEAWVREECGGWEGATWAAVAARDALATRGGGGVGGHGPPTVGPAPPSPVRAAAGRLAERWVTGVRARKRARGEEGQPPQERCVVM